MTPTLGPKSVHKNKKIISGIQNQSTAIVPPTWSAFLLSFESFPCLPSKIWPYCLCCRSRISGNSRWIIQDYLIHLNCVPEFWTIIMLLPFLFWTGLKNYLVLCSSQDLVSDPSHSIGHLMAIDIAFHERRSTSQENSREGIIISWPPVRFADPPFAIQAMVYFF